MMLIVTGMLSHQQARNDISGKKQIILNPTMEQKNGTEVVTFAEGVRILLSGGVLIAGNVLVGYSCLNGNWACPSYKLAYYNLLQDRVDISSQTQEFSSRIQ